MKNFQELKIWQLGIEIVKLTYQITLLLPKEEKFNIISQMTRAAVSIPANIAEGSSRESDKDYARMIKISLGSAFELQTYLVVIKELKWITPVQMKELDIFLIQEIKMIQSFLKKLKL